MLRTSTLTGTWNVSLLPSNWLALRNELYLTPIFFTTDTPGTEVKGKVHPYQALRLCTGRTAGEVHTCTGTEALYRPYGR
jgi:hypothetical protein